ncbi:MAG: DUF3592 domain-containing protein [Clostridiales bacterium]|nr:DUF3592 domain-containing protein [Clostridiales bacterium]
MADKIILAVFFVLGLCALAGFFVKLKGFLKLQGYKGRAKAEIVGIKEDLVKVGKDETETYYTPVVQYRAENMLYRKTFSGAASPVKPQKGDTIPIRYNVSDPTFFAKENLRDEFVQTFGLLVVAVGIFYFIYSVFSR